MAPSESVCGPFRVTLQNRWGRVCGPCLDKPPAQNRELDRSAVTSKLRPRIGAVYVCSSPGETSRSSTQEHLLSSPRPGRISPVACPWACGATTSGSEARDVPGIACTLLWQS